MKSKGLGSDLLDVAEIEITGVILLESQLIYYICKHSPNHIVIVTQIGNLISDGLSLSTPKTSDGLILGAFRIF